MEHTVCVHVVSDDEEATGKADLYHEDSRQTVVFFISAVWGAMCPRGQQMSLFCLLHIL